MRLASVTAFACSIVAVVAACDHGPTEPARDPALLEAFDSLWARYDRTYPYFTYKAVDWSAARSRFRPVAERASTPDELAQLAHDMLAPLRDVHAWTIAPSGTVVPTYLPQRFANWRRSVWETEMRAIRAQQQPGGWGYAWLGNVPYVYFELWAPGLATATVDSVLELFRQSPALVINVRMNGGGSDAPALSVAERFFDVQRTFGYLRWRNGQGHDDFTPYVPRTGVPRGPWQFVKPVLLLVGRDCFSSNESFILALRSLPNVTVVGDTTGGGSGNPATYALAGGWSYSLPRWIEYDSSLRVVEWAGIAPEQVIAATPADFDAGRDPVLEFARTWARNR